MALTAGAGLAGPVQAGTIERVSIAWDGAEANELPSGRFACCAVLSADAQIVAFISQASNLVPGGQHSIGLLVSRRQAGTTERVERPVER